MTGRGYGLIEMPAGEIFGYLRVIKMLEKRGKYSEILVRVYCDPVLGGCGNYKNVASGNLRYGRQRSCGCRKGKRLQKGEAAAREVVRVYKANAKRTGKSWELTDEQAIDLMKQNCAYCEAPPSNINNRRKSYGSFVYSGIDRVDNDKGYTIDNCVPCCVSCNRMKMAFSFDGWIEHMQLVLGNLGYEVNI